MAVATSVGVGVGSGVGIAVGTGVGVAVGTGVDVAVGEASLVAETAASIVAFRSGVGSGDEGGGDAGELQANRIASIGTMHLLYIVEPPCRYGWIGRLLQQPCPTLTARGHGDVPAHQYRELCRRTFLVQGKWLL